jgi:hypothetical protein
MVPWLLSCPAAQKPLAVRTHSASLWRGVDGVALVEAEIVDEEEEDAAGVGGAVHPEDWKYSHVGTESTAAP